MRLILIVILRLIYYTAPVLAIGSVLIPVISEHSILWALLFFPIGFAGMFSGSAGDALKRQK